VLFPLVRGGRLKRESQLLQLLNNALKDFHRVEFLSSDPLEFVHHYSDPWDQEAVALLASVIAYGNVKQIRKSISAALGRMENLGQTPSGFVRKLKSSAFRKQAHRAFDDWVHRFNIGSDIVYLFELVNRSWCEHGSVGAHFVSHLNPRDPDVGNALSAFIKEWNLWLNPDRAESFSYLLTSPEAGSCCKRWCMFLRWMGRKDDLDPGLWTKSGKLASTFPAGHFLRPDQLVMPLDTHTGRISQSLGLTARKSLNWKAAIEVTQALKKIDPKDPSRFDFALCRVGMFGGTDTSQRGPVVDKRLN